MNNIARLTISILVMLLSIGSHVSYAAESTFQETILKGVQKFVLEKTTEEARDAMSWDEREALFWDALKSQQGAYSEAKLHQAMGFWLMDSDNQWERAAVHFKKAVELDPKLYQSWTWLGMIFIDAEEGNEYFKKAIEANPDYPEPYYWLAYTYCRFKKDKEALPIWEQYVKAAKNKEGEEDRMEFAQQILKELRSGREGENLKMMRLPE